MSARAADGTVAVFFNPEIAPYRAVLDGFKESCGCTVIEHPLSGRKGPDPAAIAGAEQADLVLAIGLDALAKVKDIRNTPLLSTMVQRAPARETTGKEPAGIAMSLPPQQYLDAARRLFPSAKRIGLIFDPQNAEEYVREAVAAATGMGFQLVLREAANAAAVPGLLSGLRSEIDLLWMLPDPTVAGEQSFKHMLQFSFENKVPIVSFAKKYAVMGAIAALTVEPFDIGVQAGDMARAVRSGQAAPSFEHIRKHTLVVNRKVGKKMGFRFDLDAFGRGADVID